MEKTANFKIAILGPESTGKSELAQNLANYFGVQFVAEEAREYLKGMDTYNRQDVLKIAKIQSNKIKKNNEPILIADTEIIVTKIWQLYKYNKVDSWIENQIKKQKFDIYLLMDIDLEWKEDVLRENPSVKEREEIFQLYEQELISNNFNFNIISGLGKKRFSNALKAIQKLLN